MKGSPIIPVRLPVELLALIDQAVSRSVNRPAGQHTRSSFILSALEEKLAHLARASRKPDPVPDSYQRDSFTY